jgi:hypothetical protein
LALSATLASTAAAATPATSSQTNPETANAPAPAANTAALTVSGSGAVYSLSCKVSGAGGSKRLAPTGNAVFKDLTDGTQLGTAKMAGQSYSMKFGSFKTASLPSAMNSAVAGDFNGDGLPDLAVAQSDKNGNNSVTILLGKSDGTFKTGATYSLGNSLSTYVNGNPAIAAGDFFRRGFLDLAVANENDSTVTILEGNGNGTFSVQGSYPTATDRDIKDFPDPVAIAVGDFNGDGFPDLAIVNSYSEAAMADYNFRGSALVAVLLGNGDGSFQSPLETGVGAADEGGYGLGMAVADFNGDHNLDLAVTNNYDGNVYILTGNGDGSFQSQAPISGALGEFATHIAAGSFQGGGRQDLAVEANQGVSVLLGNGDGTFNPAQQSPISVPYAFGPIVAGDFLGNGKLDLAVTAADSMDNPNITILQGKGDGSFPAQSIVAGGGDGTALLAANFAGDGLPGLAASWSGPAEVRVWRNASTDSAAASLAQVHLIADVSTKHTLQCSYPGDANWTASASNTVAVTLPSMPAAKLSATSWNFGAEGLKTQSEPLVVTVQNSGNDTLKISSVALTGSGAGAYFESTTCGKTLAVGAQCTATVTFAPTANGSVKANLVFTDNASSGSTQTVALSGTGAAPAPAASLSTNSVNFVSTPAHVADPAKTVTLTNTGNVPLAIASIAITGTNAASFTQTNTCGKSLYAHASCDVSVVFNPQSAGTLTASLGFKESASGSNFTQSAKLTGIAVADNPQATVSPASITFPSVCKGSTKTAAVTVKSTGNYPVSISSVTVTNGTNGSFNVAKNACTSALAPGASCQVTVEFDWPGAGVSATGSLKVKDNALSGNTLTVSLAGKGTASCSN